MLSTESVFERLEHDNPRLFTTEGLSILLQDCLELTNPQQNYQFTYPSLLDRHIYLFLAGFGNASEREVVEYIVADQRLQSPLAVQVGAQLYNNLDEIVGAGFATKLLIYGTVRENVQQLQKSLGISGVSQRCVSIRDRLFSYSALVEELVLLESDRILLQSAAPKLIEYFTELVQIEPAYRLFLEDSEEQKIPTSFTALEVAADKAVMAEIYTECFRWQQVDNCSWRGEPTSKQDPDKINLVLHLDWKEEEFLFFEGHHQDKSRFPWLIAE